jgi:hypothetical protein
VRAKIAGFAAALTLAGAAIAPAHAQFVPGPFPVIVVPPPPAQNLVVPKRRSEAPKPTPEPPPDSSTPHELQCHYEGRTQVCQ